MGSSAGLTVVDRLAADLRAWREQGRIPGAALAITDLEGEDLVLVDGLSDVERRIPVSATHRFQIGSISKAATAMALLRAVAAGRVALDDSVRRRLPWFVAGEPPTTITLHQLLTHTAGLPIGGDADDASALDVWALREMTCLAPGERYWYSNVGYKALGCALAEVRDRPLPDIIEQDVLRPMGLSDARGAIRQDEREGVVTGYEPEPGSYPVSRAARIRSPLLEVTMGDGSVSASASDMVPFAAELLRTARGQGGVLDGEGARAMFHPHARTGPGRWYGYGVGLDRLDGRPVFGHGGDMLGFRTSLIGDPAAGLAVVVLANLRDAPTRRLAVHALRTLRAARAGARLRALDAPARPDASAIAGRYGGPAGRIDIVAEAGRWWMVRDKARVELIPRDESTFELDDAALGPNVMMIGDPGRAGRQRLTIGDGTYVRGERPGGRPARRAVGRARGLVGRYGSPNAWRRSIEIVDRDGRLVVIDVDGSETPLVRAGPDRWRLGREANPERLIAGALVRGRPLRLVVSGQGFARRT